MRVSAMSRRGFSCSSESGFGLEACRTSEPGKCPPVVRAVMPGMISVGSDGRRRLRFQWSARCTHSSSAAEMYTGQSKVAAQVRWEE